MTIDCHLSNRFWLFATLSLIATGCGGSDRLSRVPVTGTVKLDGNPLEKGTILFRPSTGRSGRGKIENGKIVSVGTYNIDDGIVPGQHKVAIQPIPDLPTTTFSLMDPEPQAERPRSQPKKPKKRSARIPSKYGSFDRSGLTADISDTDNELTFELTSQ